MTLEVMSDIPFTLDIPALMQRVHVRPGSEDAASFAALAEQAGAVARPKAVCRECFVQSLEEDRVTIEGITFTSHALRMNLEGIGRVFAYVATCGTEVDEIPIPTGDFVRMFWLDAIKVELLRAAVRHLQEHLARRYGLSKSSSMSPGSGDADVWPIEQQRELFSLLGDVEGAIGVRLTDSCLMVPTKSVSGVRFASAVEFYSCQLCRRENCPGRRVPFDRNLWEVVQINSNIQQE